MVAIANTVDQAIAIRNEFKPKFISNWHMGFTAILSYSAKLRSKYRAQNQIDQADKNILESFYQLFKSIGEGVKLLKIVLYDQVIPNCRVSGGWN